MNAFLRPARRFEPKAQLARLPAPHSVFIAVPLAAHSAAFNASGWTRARQARPEVRDIRALAPPRPPCYGRPMPDQAADPRAAILEATMRLAAQRPFAEITLREIAGGAGLTLLQFRDAFPSKGAVLGALSRKLDRETLSYSYDFRADDGPQERLFAVLSRRLDAMAPYKAGLKGVRDWLRADWAAALEVNKLALNAMRFCCEAAEVPLSGFEAVKLQGLALAWARVVDVWLADGEADSTKALAALSAELSRGARAVSGLDAVRKVVAPALSRLREGFNRKPETAEGDDLATPL